jgi:hypothetical protein
MTGTPVTLAEQGIFFEPEEAGDLVDVLMEAAIVLHCLAGVPDAEAAAAQAVTGGRGSCQDLAIDLQLAAADIAERAGEPAPGPENGNKPRHARMPPQNTRDTPVKNNTPKLRADNLNAQPGSAGNRIAQNLLREHRNSTGPAERKRNDIRKGLTPEI